jgi:hypothetical protein
MFEYIWNNIWDNKEWLFSGVGIALISGLIFIVRRILSNKKWPFDENEFKIKPFPRDIVKEVDSVPPFQVNEKERSYIGLKIQWKCTLQDIKKRNGDEILISFLDRGNYPWIYCNVSTNQYPEFKILKKGESAWVAGKIEEIRGNTISVVIEKIKILKK